MIKKYFGKLLYKTIGNVLPQAHFRFLFLGRLGKKVRSFCGRLMFVKCGKNTNIYPKSSLSYNLSIGDNSDIGFKCLISGKCIIGNDVIMGPEVMIYATSHKHESINVPIKYQGMEDEREVIIGNGVWIGARAIILPGVHIGDNSIIGAGSVVTKDVPNNSIVAGNPAHLIRERKINDKQI